MTGGLEVTPDELRECAAKANREAELIRNLKPAFMNAGKGMPGASAGALLGLVQERMHSVFETWAEDEETYARSLTRSAEEYEAAERAAAQEYARTHPLSYPQTYHPGVSSPIFAALVPGYVPHSERRLPELVDRSGQEGPQP